jgi:uncharacterized protein involved in response to NO
MNRLVRLTWHIYEMLSGLVMAAKAGFIFVAVPNSTGLRLPVCSTTITIMFPSADRQRPA